MSLKEKFEAGLLKSEANAVRHRPSSSLYNQFYTPRLRKIALIASHMRDLREKLAFRDNKTEVFKVRFDANPLGKIISLEHDYKPKQIQFAIPYSDDETLLVDIRKDIPSGSKTYNYTGKVEEAVNCLVEWLAEVAPEHAEKIGAILDKIENPPRGPAMVCQAPASQSETASPHLRGH